MEQTRSGYYLGLRFPGTEKTYFFSCPDDHFVLGDLAVVMTVNGLECGIVSALPKPLSTYHSELELKAILRKADERDLADYNNNIEDAKQAMVVAKNAIEKLGLPMDLTSANYTLDGSKITISYTTGEKRVDFRELLKVLAPQLGCRIELRQIAPRDKAKMIGGIGICGLPLCCSTFLNQFEGISIQRAKNQMLTLNIPKLSGPCGKLICCLTYEDDAYTEAKKEFPRFGTVVRLDEGEYTVDAINIISRTVRLVNGMRSDYKTYSLEDVLAMLNGTYKRPIEITKANEEVSLPSFGIKGDEEFAKRDSNSPQKQEKDRKNKHKNKHFHKDRDSREGEQKGPRPQENQDRGNQGQNKNHHHRHGRFRHGHGHSNNNKGQGGE